MRCEECFAIARAFGGAGSKFYPSGRDGHKNSENAYGLFPNSYAPLLDGFLILLPGLRSYELVMKGLSTRIKLTPCSLQIFLARSPISSFI